MFQKEPCLEDIVLKWGGPPEIHRKHDKCILLCFVLFLEIRQLLHISTGLGRFKCGRHRCEFVERYDETFTTFWDFPFGLERFVQFLTTLQGLLS